MANQQAQDLFEDLEFLGDDELISLAMGAPGKEALSGCTEIMMTATESAMSDLTQEKYVFQYGPRQGDPGFLEHLAKFLSVQYGDNNISKDNLMVTAGATHGLHLTATVLFKEDIPVFVEDPTYFIAIKMLGKDLGRTVIPVPVGDDGIDVDKLEEMLKKHRHKAGDKSTWKCPFWTMLYLMTVYNNPRGNCPSPEKCNRLVELARKYDVLLFTEDVYNLLHFEEGNPPPRLLSYDVSDDPEYLGCVLSNGTFSKIFAPGLRLGWIEGRPGVVRLIMTSNTAWSGGSFNHYTSRVVSAALQTGLLSQHLTKLCSVYRERMNLLCQALLKYLPAGCHFKQPKGGFFAWITLPDTVDGEALLSLANGKHKVNFITGQSTSPTGSFKNCIRLSISFADTNQIDAGVERLCKAIKEYTLNVANSESSCS
ncbi:uncharacterized protein YER152C-like [Mizuhopecten yessoensis]|uniref:Aminotransferase class I/classII large domain-containing protein n=1 Tax=Mizuhopecten yessoensis TaxID=6573 RepID=A0A210QNZ3_MIZYE|nr:uncharacterized protein YER152C-like [Mizuhopecten yessoensis]OWF50460.1 hypothetical protein KP79_PYT19385 [Mizuhopecten yessoensis]